MEPNIKCECQNMDQTKQVLCYISKNITEYLTLANCHMVDFILANHWEHFLSVDLQKELLEIPIESLHKIVSSPSSATNCLDGIKVTFPSIHTFFSSVHKMYLNRLHILSSREEVYKCLDIPLSNEENTVPLGSLMTKQKMHEVQAMAQLVSTLCKEIGASWICDLGAGKGYFSSVLARYYGFNVLAIDCKESNVNAAQSYQKTLQRELNHQKKISKKGIKNAIDSEHKNILKSQELEVCKYGESGIENLDIDCDKDNGKRRESGQYICSTKFIADDVFISDLLAQEINKINLNGSKMQSNNEQMTVHDEKYELSHAKNIGELSESSFNVSGKDMGTQTTSNKAEKIALSGLHTCGDLASSSMKLFLKDPNVKLFAGVGCCYHLLTEKFNKENLNKCGNNTPLPSTESVVLNSTDTSISSGETSRGVDSSGFPLSKQLSESNFSLGRNARMIAAQPAARLAIGESFDDRSQFWRALIQYIIICEIYKVMEKVSNEAEVTSSMVSIFFNSSNFRKSEYFAALKSLRIGRIAKKSVNFEEYASKVVNKLPSCIAQCVQLTGEEFSAYEHKFSHYHELVYKFFLLRASLGPVIEGIILLDRLVYIMEQDNVKCAHLLPLFDPVISPRHFAIVASKTRKI